MSVARRSCVAGRESLIVNGSSSMLYSTVPAVLPFISFDLSP